eukprot:TRINITY_DN15631_c0_g1_i1.p1 TRINITY_DN15631_c0_g1~~TRINITY_DN15631_c0_g1_i1.p1  ORF type:complete len:239 (-),score=16.80 TRINITY_DN15631_c0_g1_i1:235-951(-)
MDRFLAGIDWKYLYYPLERGDYKDPFDPEVQVQIAVTVITNFVGLPLAWLHFKNQSYHYGFVCFMTSLCSAIYHAADSLNANLFCMTPGNWHRLDNVFSILSFQSLAMWLMDIRSPKQEEFLRWFFLVITLWCQEKGPWRLEFTLIPDMIALAILLGSYIIYRRKPEYDWKWFVRGVVILSVAFVFFARGLDEDSDYLRLNHGLWHLLGIFAFFCFTYAVPHQYRTVLNGTVSNQKFE